MLICERQNESFSKIPAVLVLFLSGAGYQEPSRDYHVDITSLEKLDCIHIYPPDDFCNIEMPPCIPSGVVKILKLSFILPPNDSCGSGSDSNS
ncbi:hypothetical protein AVEN_84437-1 [Araneus ventricosus]|uniref:Uncharacterized protein n=1 Tax=Araneus ventricosus TaxID=182803 RepID=A0A4Y2R1A0_ARAVE|nr:hypothetical protein AVEN_84437-1 [Araneus ventricosus]